ncbi:MAG: hypothetical protein V3V18_13700 [Methylococcales bacterium]
MTIAPGVYFYFSGSFFQQAISSSNSINICEGARVTITGSYTQTGLFGGQASLKLDENSGLEICGSWSSDPDPNTSISSTILTGLDQSKHPLIILRGAVNSNFRQIGDPVNVVDYIEIGSSTMLTSSAHNYCNSAITGTDIHNSSGCDWVPTGLVTADIAPCGEISNFPGSPSSTSLTLITEVTNDDGGTAVINDLGVATSAGNLTFDAGTTSGDTTTYTSTQLSINGGSYNLSGNDIVNYTKGLWSCNGSLELVTLGSGTVTIAEGDNVTCTITYDDTPMCTALTGDVSEIAAAIPFQVASGDKVFVASNSPLPSSAGHLKAYAVQANGAIATSVAWDAATLMDTTKREAGLYSTNASGTKVLFNSGSFDAAAFSSSGSPTVAKIKEYTIEPSVDSGVYLAGRASGSWLGPMSRGNDVALLTQMNNMGQFLTDSAYRSFYNGTISSRSEKILVSSDDGFLYAFDQSTGQLSWGWMPRSLAGELKNYTSFQSQRLMRGKLNIIDAKDLSGNYATYVVGSYKHGLGHYALKLDSNGALDSVVWDQDYSASFNTAPNHGEIDFFRDGAEQTYVTYVVTDSSNQSTLVLREITTASTNTEVTLNFNATATPFVIQNFNDSNGPAAKTLYLGDDSGNIQRTALLDSGSLDNAANLKSALEGSSVGDLYASEPILFLGASSSNTGGQYYLRAQSESRLTLLEYNSSSTNWDKRWTSYVGGAGSWNTSGIYAADNSGAPTDVDGDGFFTNVTANGIQSLPADARITDAAQIVANNVILPVSVQAAGSCFGKAYFYLYNLTNGVFPDNKLMNLDSSKISTNIALGYGDPSRVSIADMPSTEFMLGYGLTDQNKDNDVEINTPFRINDKVATGIRGWKERRQ